MMYKGNNGCWYDLSFYRNFYVEKIVDEKFCIKGIFGNSFEDNEYIEGWFRSEEIAACFLHALMELKTGKSLCKDYGDVDSFIKNKYKI